MPEKSMTWDKRAPANAPNKVALKLINYYRTRVSPGESKAIEVMVIAEHFLVKSLEWMDKKLKQLHGCSTMIKEIYQGYDDKQLVEHHERNICQILSAACTCNLTWVCNLFVYAREEVSNKQCTANPDGLPETGSTCPATAAVTFSDLLPICSLCLALS